MGKRLSKTDIKINFDAVLEDLLPDRDLRFEDAMLAIAYTAFGTGTIIELPVGNEMLSARQIVKKYKLEPFVDVVRECNQREVVDGGFTHGQFVINDGKIYRFLMHREVTPLAMPRTANHEALLETMSGEYVGFVAENELEAISEVSRQTLAKILADMVNSDELKLGEALCCYISSHFVNQAIVLLAELAEAAIIATNAGHSDQVVDLPQKPTAQQITSALNLKPFITVKPKTRK